MYEDKESVELKEKQFNNINFIFEEILNQSFLKKEIFHAQDIFELSNKIYKINKEE